MLSPFANGRFKKLISDGINLDPSEIIRLNDLALDIENCKNGSDMVTAPRIAFAGDAVLYQPTIAAENWIDTFATHFWIDESLYFATAWACVNGMKADFFTDYTEEKKTRHVIEAWGKKLTCTKDQLDMALSYVIGVIDEDEIDNGEQTHETLNHCFKTELVDNCIAAGIGGTVKDVEALTAERVSNLFRRWVRLRVAESSGDTDEVVRSMKNNALCIFEKCYAELRLKHGNK